MQHTRSDRMTVPEDLEELRALFLRRMRERDRIHNDRHESHSEDTGHQGTPEDLHQANLAETKTLQTDMPHGGGNQGHQGEQTHSGGCQDPQRG